MIHWTVDNDGVAWISRRKADEYATHDYQCSCMLCAVFFYASPTVYEW
jgi:hypothetical protein